MVDCYKKSSALLWSPPTLPEKLVPKGTGTWCTKRLSLSHFPDNATVGALAAMCHSSAGSSGMGGDRLYPSCPRQQLNTNISITCFVPSSWEGGLGRRTESVEPEVHRKHSVPFSAWLAPRCMMEAHLKYCHDA